MIFSTDKCPICGETVNMTHTTDGVDQYDCAALSSIHSISNGVIKLPHYRNINYVSGAMSITIIDGFYLAHFEVIKRTYVYFNLPDRPPTFIYEIPLLDMDYSKPHAVEARLKRLVPFS